jgi:hypothetical protein
MADLSVAIRHAKSEELCRRMVYTHAFVYEGRGLDPSMLYVTVRTRLSL